MKEKPKRKISVWERVQAAARFHGAAIDEQIDLFLSNGYRSKFNLAKYIKGYELSAPVVKILVTFYRPHFEELEFAASGEDVEFRASYPCNDRELKRYLEFVGGLVKACDDFIEKSSSQRKPRAKKVKPPEVVVANLKTTRECVELGIGGYDATKLLGAQEAWFYDIEKRKLILYKAADKDGLGVKGTTITNYDENSSGSRPIRKPSEFFKDLLIGCLGLNRAWHMIRGKISPVKSRTNNNMILLAVG